MSWWILALGVAAGLLPRVRLETPALIVLALLVTMACLTALSINWAVDNGKAFDQLVQLIAIIGVFAVCLTVSTRDSFRGWLNGMALGLGFIVLLAVASRYFPGLGDDSTLSRDIGGVAGRLSWPLGYWNALGTVISMSLCLCAWLGANARDRRTRAVATGFLSIGFLALYMTSSRGSTLAVLAGMLILFAGGPNRVRFLASLLMGAIAGFILILIASPMDALLLAKQNSDAKSHGHTLLAASIVFFGLMTAGRYWLDGRIDSIQVPKLSRWLLVVPALLVVVAFVAVNPVHQIDNFTAKPVIDQNSTTSNSTDHLLSGGGNGRWQFWTASFDAFKTEPLHGIGAGGFQDYFTQHGDLPVAVKHSHSLPMQVLAELGIFGFLLLMGIFGVPIYVGLNRWLTGRMRLRMSGISSGGDREADRSEMESWQALPAFMSIFAVGAVAMGIDWVADFPAVTGPVMISVAAMIGATTAPSTREAPAEGSPAALVIMLATVAVAGVALWASFVSYGEQTHLKTSRTQVDNNNLPAAAVAAQKAIDAAPWDAEPRIQLALVQELAGHYREALNTTNSAINRSPEVGVYWVLQARLWLRLGNVTAAQLSFHRALELDPKNQIAARA